MTERNEHTKCQFELTEDYLIINSHYYPGSKDDYTNELLYIEKKDISWLYKNLAELLEPWKVYARLYRTTSEDSDNYLDIEILGCNDRCTTWMLNIDSDGKKGYGCLNIPFNEREPFNKDDSLYPFLIELEKYIPEEQRNSINPIWKQGVPVSFERCVIEDLHKMYIHKMEIPEILKNAVFDYGWRAKGKFSLFHKDFEVTYIFDAYEESEKINDIQKERLNTLKMDEEAISEKAGSLLKKYAVENQLVQNVVEVFDKAVLSSILFTQEGEVLLMYEFSEDEENGVAVRVLPDFDVGPQNAFL